ncbi:MAG: sigma-70 family RNA polymerase sigma factor [Gammaproteobacteria bacterium]|uniref:RNA polymerase sigma-70 factor, ECF subfamily n=1 Tax=Marinomonas polaris DSM 16579 TaxID=1122206 RepID=A0A1M5E6C0_9GAMM|nr:sigma-70 family RNA polymerase sigma factor [Marinomonas polaris]MBU1295090.1 sigma-70 family RNA polymerase sigma factor [Gammaproteobacteria bacterium]MBU1468824.1 sigma-70 family RNA polymerase sigma factor [Gammaproteobacteria bacterium]MBU2239084.1 sigma-70 family RNA polymerase sigma factor [Gammaproteobacteria bacterium]MBU2317283.1 sigma-70 family RNA polymerase sigma factor [Gammaproteobacteria bacterium]MBU2414945.1 sigma-70 family RNA polymerase sigma factor [Gammaproteobacteria |tara:strand:- start:11489 stop:12007 length:519 start_codon:yes stop_codon:yes gene_type:complete
MNPERQKSQQVGELYAEHSSWLTGWIRSRLGCHELAADIAQDTFVRLLKRPKYFSNMGEARAFLSTIAKGLYIDHWRRKQVEQAWLESLAHIEEEFVPSAEHSASMIELLCELDAMIAKLPKKVANTLILSQLHGLTYREIAERLSVSERMVKRYMAQAMLQCLLFKSDRSL